MNGFRRLKRPVSFSGRGLHSGELSKVTVSPLQEGGPVLETGGERAPLASCRAEGVGRGTSVLLPGGARARTTEHLFASLLGLGLWSVRVSLDGPEMPACGGCASGFADELFLASEQIPPCEIPGRGAISPALPVALVDEARGGFLSLFPGGGLRVTYVIQYDRSPIGTSMASYDHEADDFRECIAPARTFALASEVDRLRADGLARGGSLENAVVVGADSVQASGGLRFPDEFVRHKILDLLGDLYLLGSPLNARIIAVRAGHAMHCRLVERLRRLGRTKGDRTCSIFTG